MKVTLEKNYRKYYTLYTGRFGSCKASDRSGKGRRIHGQGMGRNGDP